MAGPGAQAPSTKLVKPRTKAGKRSLEKRAPKLVEDPRRALILYGNSTSQIIKDVLVDVHKLKGTDALKFSRKNDDVKPFDAGGEASLEVHANRSNCSLFAVGSHTKKRPQNLVLGRMYDFRLYDCIEFGVTSFKPIREFSAATMAQLGNKPAFVFVGEAFESDAGMRQVRSLLLDFFRGRQVEHVNLKGLDRVVFVTHQVPSEGGGGSGGSSASGRLAGPGSVAKPVVLLRQYAVKYKKSGTRIPRVELAEMGPRLDLEVRRSRQPPPDVEKEACHQPKITPKKQKNVGGDMMDGKVGRIYMPKQDVESMALRKMKGKKRSHRDGGKAEDEGKRTRRKTGAGDVGEDENA
jgi:ribosome production factor 2